MTLPLGCLKNRQKEEQHREMNVINSTIECKATLSDEPPQAFHGAPQTPTSQLGKWTSQSAKG